MGTTTTLSFTSAYITTVISVIISNAWADRDAILPKPVFQREVSMRPTIYDGVRVQPLYRIAIFGNVPR